MEKPSEWQPTTGRLERIFTRDRRTAVDKAIQKVVDVKKDNPARFKALKAALESKQKLSWRELKDKIHDSKDAVFEVFFNAFRSFDNAHRTTKSAKSVIQEFQQLIGVFQKLIRMLPEDLKDGLWQYDEIIIVLKKLLHPATSFRVRHDSIGAFLAYYQILKRESPDKLHHLYELLIPLREYDGGAAAENTDAAFVMFIDVAPVMLPQQTERGRRAAQEQYLEVLLEKMVEEPQSCFWTIASGSDIDLERRDSFSFLYERFKFIYLPIIFPSLRSSILIEAGVPVAAATSDEAQSSHAVGANLCHISVVVVKFLTGIILTSSSSLARPPTFGGTSITPSLFGFADQDRSESPASLDQQQRDNRSPSPALLQTEPEAELLTADVPTPNHLRKVADVILAGDVNQSLVHTIFREAFQSLAIVLRYHTTVSDAKIAQNTLLPSTAASLLRRIVDVYRIWITRTSPTSAPAAALSADHVDHGLAAGPATTSRADYAFMQSLLQVFFSSSCSVFLTEIDGSQSAFVEQSLHMSASTTEAPVAQPVKGQAPTNLSASQCRQNAIDEQIDVFKRIINVCRYPVMHMDMSQRTWTCILETLLRVLDHWMPPELGAESPTADTGGEDSSPVSEQLVGVDSADFPSISGLPLKERRTIFASVDKYLFQTVLVAFIKANLHVPIRPQLWDQLKRLFSSRRVCCWPELINQWSKIMITLTRVLSREVYGIDVDDAQRIAAGSSLIAGAPPTADATAIVSGTTRKTSRASTASSKTKTSAQPILVRTKSPSISASDDTFASTSPHRRSSTIDVERATAFGDALSTDSSSVHAAERSHSTSFVGGDDAREGAVSSSTADQPALDELDAPPNDSGADEDLQASAAFSAMQKNLHVMAGGTIQGWTAESACVVWMRMLGILGRYSDAVSKPSAFHGPLMEALDDIARLLLVLSDRMHLNTITSRSDGPTSVQPFTESDDGYAPDRKRTVRSVPLSLLSSQLDMTISVQLSQLRSVPPIYALVPLLLQVIDELPLPAYERSVTIAYRLLCRSQLRNGSQLPSHEYLAHLYRVLHSGLILRVSTTGGEQSTSNLRTTPAIIETILREAGVTLYRHALPHCHLLFESIVSAAESLLLVGQGEVAVETAQRRGILAIQVLTSVAAFARRVETEATHVFDETSPPRYPSLKRFDVECFEMRVGNAFLRAASGVPTLSLSVRCEALAALGVFLQRLMLRNDAADCADAGSTKKSVFSHSAAQRRLIWECFACLLGNLADYTSAVSKCVVDVLNTFAWDYIPRMMVTATAPVNSTTTATGETLYARAVRWTVLSMCETLQRLGAHLMSVPDSAAVPASWGASAGIGNGGVDPLQWHFTTAVLCLTDWVAQLPLDYVTGVGGEPPVEADSLSSSSSTSLSQRVAENEQAALMGVVERTFEVLIGGGRGVTSVLRRAQAQRSVSEHANDSGSFRTSSPSDVVGASSSQSSPPLSKRMVHRHSGDSSTVAGKDSGVLLSVDDSEIGASTLSVSSSMANAQPPHSAPNYDATFDFTFTRTSNDETGRDGMPAPTFPASSSDTQLNSERSRLVGQVSVYAARYLLSWLDIEPSRDNAACPMSDVPEWHLLVADGRGGESSGGKAAVDAAVGSGVDSADVLSSRNVQFFTIDDLVLTLVAVGDERNEETLRPSDNDCLVGASAPARVTESAGSDSCTAARSSFINAGNVDAPSGSAGFAAPLKEVVNLDRNSARNDEHTFVEGRACTEENEEDDMVDGRCAVYLFIRDLAGRHCWSARSVHGFRSAIEKYNRMIEESSPAARPLLAASQRHAPLYNRCNTRSSAPSSDSELVDSHTLERRNSLPRRALDGETNTYYFVPKRRPAGVIPRFDDEYEGFEYDTFADFRPSLSQVIENISDSCTELGVLKSRRASAGAGDPAAAGISVEDERRIAGLLEQQEAIVESHLSRAERRVGKQTVEGACASIGERWRATGFQAPPSPWTYACRFLSQFGYTGDRRRRSFFPLSKTPELMRDLRVVDRRNYRDFVKIGVVYIMHGQEKLNDIMRNDAGSPLFDWFLEQLGWSVDLASHRGWMGGFPRDPSRAAAEAEQETSVYFASPSLEMMTHVSTRIGQSHQAGAAGSGSGVGGGGGDYMTTRMRHIGNDAVIVVWSEHWRDYERQTMRTAFADVIICIYPIESTGLFRIQLLSKPGVGQFGPLRDGQLVESKMLAALVRATAINASRMLRAFMPEYAWFFEERARYLDALIEKHTCKSSYQEFMENVLMPAFDERFIAADLSTVFVAPKSRHRRRRGMRTITPAHRGRAQAVTAKRRRVVARPAPAPITAIGADSQSKPFQRSRQNSSGVGSGSTATDSVPAGKIGEEVTGLLEEFVGDYDDELSEWHGDTDTGASRYSESADDESNDEGEPEELASGAATRFSRLDGGPEVDFDDLGEIVLDPPWLRGVNCTASDYEDDEDEFQPPPLDDAAAQCPVPPPPAVVKPLVFASAASTEGARREIQPQMKGAPPPQYSPPPLRLPPPHPPRPDATQQTVLSEQSAQSETEAAAENAELSHAGASRNRDSVDKDTSETEAHLI